MAKPYYQDDYVTIYHGDCREIVPTLEKFDLLLTDPPYGLPAKSTHGRGQLKSRILNSDSIKKWDIAPSHETFELLISKAKNYIIWGGNYFNIGPCRCVLCWDKKQPWKNFSQVEMAWTSFDLPAKIYKADCRFPKQHPTQKPLSLISWCISLAGEINTIIDPFAGSGTTGRVAKDLGHKCILIEREERYCELSAKGMSQEVLPLFTETV